MVSIIVACDPNRIIGAKGKLPWRMPEDLRIFKQKTMGCSVIMGKNTWNSIPDKNKPLEGRANIVLSKTLWFPVRTKDYGPFFMSDMVGAISSIRTDDRFEQFRDKDIYIIGGENIYKSALELDVVDQIIMSKIVNEYEGDVYFPKLDSDWVVTDTEFKTGFDLVTLKKVR